MFSRGEFTIDNVTYGAIVSHTKLCTEVILVLSGQVVSAYKTDSTGSYSYNNVRAKELAQVLLTGVKGCTAKNGIPAPFELGAMTIHEFIKTKVEYLIQEYRGEVVGALIQSERLRAELEYCKENLIPQGIPYVKLTVVKKNTTELADDDLDAVPVRSVEEIALEKESIEWLANKKYYIVNDDETAEKLFTYFENYDNVIAYDTETTGLRINCFGKIGSEYMEKLIKYNKENPDEQIRADKLVGIIFCVEPDVSYYFPCFNRKFKNLYQDKDSIIRKKVIQNIRAKYTLGNSSELDEDMTVYIRSTSDEDLDLGVILMERVRRILETKHLVAHNGTFEWKVGYQYGIDTNIKDDTMIMHKIMYKFRSTTSNRGEPSDLKYLAKRELGMDQWELKDFFPNLKEDKSGTVRSKKNAKKSSGGSRIDFSYMTYEGTKVYAPTDGDVTLQLFNKYKRDLLVNHKEMVYIYEVELIVSMAIAYMEFYGHRLDESKIDNAKNQTLVNMALIEEEIRQAVDYANDNERDAYNKLQQLRKDINSLNKATNQEDIDRRTELESHLMEYCDKLKQAISENTQHVINLSAPGQVADLFYDKLKYPLQGDKKSVAKNVIKALIKEKDEEGNPKYPVANMYSKYKNEDTLLTKFFDCLQYFMYPGGFIFSSYGQIAAATGRMSCSKPNAQQYPKVITKIVYPRDGYVMLDADYSQIEYRVLTAMAHNEDLAVMFSDPDSDYHTLMASLMYDTPYASVTPKMRSAAKSFNFGIPYGMGFGSLAVLLHGNRKQSSIDDAKEKYELYFKNQPRTRQFFDNVKEMAQIHGWTRTLFNRYRYYSFIDKDGNINNAKKAAALRQAGNAVIQGCLGGETRIQTKEFGIVKIKDYAGYNRIQIWDGDRWTLGDITYSGKKQKCIVHFNNGQSIICSPIHKFLVDDRCNISTDECIKKDLPELVCDSDNLRGRFIECQHLKTGYIVKINLDANKLTINNFEDRQNKVNFVRYNEDTVGSTHKYECKVECVVVESVEITDEYIDMYDVCNTERGYYVADGIITHNTAADIFKIGVARNFNYIRKNKLFGKLLIVNMIHDEQLMEIDTRKLNVQRVVTDACQNMQFGLEGFPPLFVGAGLGEAWGVAKGKMAEIHSNLLNDLINESKDVPIFRREGIDKETSPKEILDYFNHRIHEFRRKKVYDYLANPENWGKDIHPAIGSLINLQFNYGRGDEASAYKGPNGETYTDQEFLELNIGDFLKENNIQAESTWFKFNDNMSAEQEDAKEKESEGYDDTDEDEPEIDDILIESDDTVGIFSEINESDKLFGSSIQDMISIFGCCILVPHKLCGLDIRGYGFRQIDAMVNYIAQFSCEPDDPDAKRVVFLKEGNVLKYTDVYVKNIKSSELEKQYKEIRANKH